MKPQVSLIQAHAGQLFGYASTQQRESYWYHPDYLGNTEFVTDADGAPFQYFWYSAWGEAIESQHSNQGSFSSRYRFNAKEWDGETGNYYYGARYYDPKVSVWLSVDPLADKYPSLTPYNYVENTPVNLIDPDGRSATCPTCPDEKEFNLFKESEVEFTYNEKNNRIEKATNDKLNIEEAKDPHLETLTFLKYTMQGDKENDNTMTDYFDNPNAEGGYGITEVEQKVDGLNLKMTIVNDNSYPTAGGTIEYKSEKGFEGTGANGPSSRLRTILKSGYLEGATPNEGVELLNISYPYSQKGAQQQKKDASYY